MPVCQRYRERERVCIKASLTHIHFYKHSTVPLSDNVDGGDVPLC